MSLTATQIAAVIREVGPALLGGAVQKIHQPLPTAIILEVRRPGRSLSLLLSADPETARLHFLSHRPPNPPAPPAFCQLLRAHIEGGRIEAVDQLAGDRIVRIGLLTHVGPMAFIAELTGRNANLLLLDSCEKVMGALHDGRERTGNIYRPPPVRTIPGLHDEDTTTPALDEDRPFPLSSFLEQQYQQRDEELGRTRLRQTRLAQLRKAIKKTTRRIEALQADLDKAARYQGYARYGELLKTYLGKITKGQDRVTVEDYFDPLLPELVIPLNPAKNARGNMEDYFKKHRKYLGAEREIRPRLEDAQRELTALQAERLAVERDAWKPEASASPTHSTSSRPVPPRQKSAGPFRRFVSGDGLQIFVGRNARENEELTFGVARSHDLWLHARGTPGSHVVLRLEKGADPPDEAVRDAATLALLYSDLKKSGKGEVIYAKRSGVRKVKGQSPGTVTVTQDKTIYVELDPARLKRLKEAALTGLIL